MAEAQAKAAAPDGVAQLLALPVAASSTPAPAAAAKPEGNVSQLLALPSDEAPADLPAWTPKPEGNALERFADVGRVNLGMAAHLFGAAAPTPTTKEGLQAERFETRYAHDLAQTEIATPKAIWSGTSPLKAPVRNLWELAATPIEGLAHGATSIVGWVVGAYDVASGQAAKAKGDEAFYAGQAPAPQPSTMAGRAWNVFGMVFAPVTSATQAAGEELESEPGGVRPWMHLALEATSFGGQVLGAKGLGELGGMLRSGEAGETAAEAPTAFSTKRPAPAKVKVPERPGAGAAPAETDAGQPAQAGNDLFEGDEERRADVLGRRSDTLQARREGAAADVAHEDDATFENWFRGSHARDEQGQPLTLYHGTNGDFTTFEPGQESPFDYGHGDGRGSEAIWFSRDPAYASGYTDARIPGANVRPVHIQIRRPFNAPDTFNLKDQEAMVNRAKAEGYDSVVFPNGEYAVFRPSQIRSIFAPSDFDRLADAQADSIEDYQRTVLGAAKAWQDNADFDAAQTAEERVDQVLRGGGPGHAGAVPGALDTSWHHSLRQLATLAGIDPSGLFFSAKEPETIGLPEAEDTLALAADFEKNPETGYPKPSPRLQRHLDQMRANRTLRAQAAQLKRDAALKLKRLFPKNAGNASEAHIAHVAQTMVTGAMERQRAESVNVGLRRLFARMNTDQQLAWWRWYQKGTAMPADMGNMANWESIKTFYKDLFERGRQEAEIAGTPIEPMHQAEYFPQFAKPKDWTEREALGNPQRARAFPTMDNLLDAGVEPLSMNPAVHVQYWLRGLERTIARGEFDWQRQNGGLRIVPKGYVPAPDEATMEGLDGFKYAGKAHLIAHLQNTVLAKPFMGFEASFMNALKNFGIVKNATQSIAFGLNAFHGFNIGVFVRPIHALTESLALIEHPLSPSGVVDMAKAVTKAYTTGDRPLVRGTKISARRMRRIASGKEGGVRWNPKTGTVEMPPGGDPFLDVIDVVRHGADPSILDTPGKELLRRAMVAGFEIHNPEWTNQALAKLTESLQEKTLSGYMRAGGWIVPTFLRSIGYPMMDQFVPLLKLRAFAADTERWVAANPTVEAGSDAERVAFSRLRRENDQRFGEMNTKLLGWNPMLSAAFHGSMVSFGWNFGLLSQFGGGAKDAVGAAFDAATGKKRAAMRSRALYASLYAGYVCAMGALVMKGFSGQDPKTLGDCIYPVVGKDKDGKEIRVRLPSMMQDFGAEAYNVRDKGLLAGTKAVAMNKAAPIFSMLDELWTGKNWKDQEIRDPYAPFLQQTAQSFKAVMENDEPWSITQMTRKVPSETPEQQRDLSIAAGFGINRAPGYVTTPAPVEQIYRLGALAAGTHSWAAAQLYQAEHQAQLPELFHEGRRSGNFGKYRLAERQFFKNWNATHPEAPVTSKAIMNERMRLLAPPAAFTLRDLGPEDQEYIWHSMLNEGDHMQMLAQYFRYFHNTVRAYEFPKLTPEQHAELTAARRALNAPPKPATSAPQG